MVDTPEVTPQMLQRLARQGSQLQRRDLEIEHKASEIQRKDREIKLHEALAQKLQFELARFKRWQFGAQSEAMTADQRRLF